MQGLNMEKNRMSAGAALEHISSLSGSREGEARMQKAAEEGTEV